MIPCVPEFYFSKAETQIQKETQQHIEEGRFDMQAPVPNFAFHEYLILNLINENLQIKQEISQLKQLIHTKDTETKENYTDNRNLQQERKKRKYERKGEILERKFVCEHKNCSRSYSSRIALNSHLRKKHAQKTVCSVQNVIDQ